MKGFIYMLLVFVFCFALVHAVKLAYIGFLSVKKKKETPKRPPKKKSKPKPVYYLVEKRPQRETYSEPREIEFK